MRERDRCVERLCRWSLARKLEMWLETGALSTEGGTFE